MKKLISILLVAVITTFTFTMPAFAEEVDNEIFITASYNNFSRYIPKLVNEFAINRYKEMSTFAEEYKIAFGLSEDDFNGIALGEPFCIYNTNGNNQQPIFYYPLLNSDNEYILLMTVINTNYSMQCSLDNDLVDELNQISYFSEDYVFYKTNDLLIAQALNKCYCINQTMLRNVSAGINYYEIYNKIIDSTKQLSTIDIDKNKNNSQSVGLEKYSPSFSSVVNDKDYKEKMIKLFNAKGQGNYGMCWAASVATIANFIKGTNVTAKNVCKLMNVGYNAGATMAVKRSALNKYGVKYNKVRSRSLKWSEIKNNIDKKKPVAISAFSSSGGHAVTLIGYRSFKVNQFIAIWDSAANNGKGSTKVIYYLGGSTTFQSSSSGPVFTWTKSLSMY